MSGKSDSNQKSSNPSKSPKPATLWLKEEYWHRDKLLEPEPPYEIVHRSYLNQLLQVELDGSIFVLVPEIVDLVDWPEPIDPGSPRYQSVLERLNGFWLSNWHVYGSPLAVSELAHYDEILNRQLDDVGARAPQMQRYRAAAFHLHGAWVEGGVLVTGVEEAEIAELAALAGQQAYVQIDGESLRVKPVLGAQPASRQSIRLIELEEPRCPMLRGCHTDIACERPGGGYTSASMAMALLWNQQRSVAVETLGCGPCSRGLANHNSYSLASIHKQAVASRHGTATEVFARPRFAKRGE